MRCGESYRLHYLEKLRPKTTNASLLWGSAMDVALNCLLLKEGDALETFYNNWESAFINGRQVKLFNSELVNYAERDIDTDLLNEKHMLLLKEYARQCGFNQKLSIQEHVDECQATKKQRMYKTFKPEQQSFLNAVAWCCLESKGELTIRAYREKVLPRIVEVISVQQKVDTTNDVGDSVVGYVDFIAKLDDGNTYILDNKSSYMRYDDDSAGSSPQLALYSNLMGINHVGFIVYYKTVVKNKVRTCVSCGTVSDNNRVKTCVEVVNGKRCGGEFSETMSPDIDIQFFLSPAKPRLKEMIMSNFDAVNALINNKVFIKNTATCKNVFGGPCEFINVCYKDSLDGLDKVE